jgi:putative transposase
MPRRARMYLPGFPYHVVQRGNNREACFIEPENYQFYLQLWQELSSRYRVAVHAYCLMTNHIHFLATPQTSTGLSDTLKVVGSRYAQYINRKYKRTGTLWEGRHRSSLVQSERYLLTCMRYIELNPVRANMVARPEEYRWSSYGVNAWGDESWIRPHAEYLRLGQSLTDQCTAYRAIFKHQLSEEDLDRFRKAAHYCQPVADDRFREQIEKQYGIKLGQMARGRPKRTNEELHNI